MSSPKIPAMPPPPPYIPPPVDSAQEAKVSIKSQKRYAAQNARNATIMGGHVMPKLEKKTLLGS